MNSYFFEKYEAVGLRSVQAEPSHCVIPAWSAGIQIDMDVPEASMRTWIPGLSRAVQSSMFKVRSPNSEPGTRNPEQPSDAGMTNLAFSLSAGERKITEQWIASETPTRIC